MALPPAMTLAQHTLAVAAAASLGFGSAAQVPSERGAGAGNPAIPPCAASATVLASQLIDRGDEATFDLTALSLREDLRYGAGGGWAAVTATEGRQRFELSWSVDARAVERLRPGGGGLTEVRLRFGPRPGTLQRLTLTAPSGQSVTLFEGEISRPSDGRDVVVSPLVADDFARAPWYAPAAGADLDWRALSGAQVAGTWVLRGYADDGNPEPLQLSGAELAFEDRIRARVIPPGDVASVGADRFAVVPDRSQTYRFAVVDGGGCAREYAFPVQIAGDCAFEVRRVVTRPPSCPGAADGRLAFVVAGARPGVTYDLDGRRSSSGAFANLRAGDYRLTVRGAGGCLYEEAVTLPPPERAYVDAVWTSVSCAPARYEAHLQAYGPVGVASATWGDQASELPTAPVLAHRTDLAPGVYPFSYTDDNGCDYRDTLRLQPAGAVEATVATTPPPCAGEGAGDVVLRPSGGLPPYEARWADGAAGLERDFLFAGAYEALVYDSRGCEASVRMTIAEPDRLRVRHTLLPPACERDRDGVLEVEATGGAPPYRLRVDGGPWRPNLRADTLEVGAHSFTLVDAAGCEVTHVVDVRARTALPHDFRPRVLAVRQPVRAGDTVRLNVGPLADGRYASKWTYTEDAYIECDTCTSTALAPEHPGTVLVRLRDSLGCVARASVVLRVDPGADLRVPEGFGPGHRDPADRILRVKGRSGTVIDRFAVYDSNTGVLVFEAVDFVVGAPRGWDGTLEGDPAPAGDYRYELQARRPTGEVSLVEGKTTLVR